MDDRHVRVVHPNVSLYMCVYIYIHIFYLFKFKVSYRRGTHLRYPCLSYFFGRHFQ